MGKRLCVTVGCLAILALAAHAEAAPVNAGDHPLASAPEQRLGVGVASDVGSGVPYRQPGRGHADWLILAGGGGDGDGGPAATSTGNVRGGIAAAVEAVQDSQLPTERKAELLNLLDTGRKKFAKSEVESNRRRARKYVEEAMSILNDVMNIVEAEG